jgi:hypothetical protein
MKRLFFIFVLALFSNFIIGQQTLSTDIYKINVYANSAVLSKHDLNDRLSKLNLEAYRLRDKETIVFFENGFEIILFSAKQLLSTGKIQDANIYPIDFDRGYEIPRYTLLDNGNFLAAHKTIQVK